MEGVISFAKRRRDSVPVGEGRAKAPRCQTKKSAKLLLPRRKQEQRARRGWRGRRKLYDATQRNFHSRGLLPT